MEDSTLSMISSTFRTKKTNNDIDKTDIMKSNSNKRRNKSNELKKSQTKKKMKKNENENENEKEKDEVERKIRALQRIVPGGESLGVDKLFEETAGYIMALQSQLKAMKTLANLFQGLDYEKRKFGG